MKDSNLKIELITLSDHIIQSVDSKLSIIGLFDTFNLEKVPFNWPRMFVVVVFNGPKNSQQTIKVEIKNPSGKSVFSQQGPIKTGENGKSNLLIELNNFPLGEYGSYSVEVGGEEKLVFYVRKAVGGSNAKKSSSLPN